MTEFLLIAGGGLTAFGLLMFAIVKVCRAHGIEVRMGYSPDFTESRRRRAIAHDNAPPLNAAGEVDVGINGMAWKDVTKNF